jgi:hypothetical protein
MGEVTLSLVIPLLAEWHSGLDPIDQLKDGLLCASSIGRGVVPDVLMDTQTLS